MTGQSVKRQRLFNKLAIVVPKMEEQVQSVPEYIVLFKHIRPFHTRGAQEELI